ncbi:GNAT family N-acetyltransferase [Paucibacter sp. APW11]|uniref:GNAT family N-acetyltransferase n=1 Tax=Roseateles aquae TaxID=3077235 RepID=A0ABU3PHJ5_9BURK|nr:GNAT family N-acetyltransferase [Paucibacter sp. APW11]MDT9001998.1 GNAT family N-acetyltransferase [Paucibacter sp. APW11]
MAELTTARLRVRAMNEDDAPFMLELLNQASWLQFIGDRGVRTLADARGYIRQGPMAMMERHGFGFDVVEGLSDGAPLGLCGLAQRDYLDAPDIGFAFLERHAGKGLAHEAAAAVLADAQQRLGLMRILATTRRVNLRSQALLKRLGLQLERLIHHPEDQRELLLFSTAA